MLNKAWSIFQHDGLFALFKRILVKFLRLFEIRVDEILSLRKSSFSFNFATSVFKLTPRAGVKSFESLQIKTCIPKAVSKHYLNHRFDLLGSGWVQVCYGMKCIGMAGYSYSSGPKVKFDVNGQWLKGRINKSNLLTAQKIWKRVDENYMPIDWQLDYKSGFRWSEKVWALRLPHGHLPGVDVKVPWELSRMQHLPQLALRACALGKKNNEALLIFREIRNQWLDFIALNPPGFGVNWACPMDVAIRSANWCLAWDILQASGFSLDSEDHAILAHSLYDHGCHIIKFLEWSSDRANHYLANITGLIFIASYLKLSEETDSWLAFSIKELVAEVDRQFYEDGCNFEGSTAYHRLSTEMVLFSTALVLGLPSSYLENLKKYKYKEIKNLKKALFFRDVPLQIYSLSNEKLSIKRDSPFPEWYFQRMERMAEFIMDITKPNGHIPQIGDNDNGRFFKLYPKYHKMSVIQAKQKYLNLHGYDSLNDDDEYHIEDHLDCTHIVNASYALFDRSDFEEWLVKRSDSKIKNQDYIVIKFLSNSISISDQNLPRTMGNIHTDCIIGSEKEFNRTLLKIEKNNNNCVLFNTENKFYKSIDELSLYSYPDFGLYLLVSDTIYLAIRCWPGKKPYSKSHMHLDQFSVELVIDGKEIICDPGSYVYSPLPIERWKYRSNEAHFTPLIVDDFEDWKKLDPFYAITLQPAFPDYFGPYGFLSSIEGRLEGGSFCLISIKDNEIKLFGFANDSKQAGHEYLGKKISDGYGSVSNNLSIRMPDEY